MVLFTTQEPLLVGHKYEFGANQKPQFLAKSAKWVLKFVMWAIFIAWVIFIFLFPLQVVYRLYMKWVRASSGNLYGMTGTMFLVFSGPILLIAFLAVFHLILSKDEELYAQKKQKSARFRLWTFPVIVDGPFGVVSAAELIGIVLFSVYVIWAISIYTVVNISLLPLFEFYEYKRYLMLQLTGLRFGFIGLICLAFLFLPVTRGSILLRLIDIPFEHATRYHVWLGHLTMFLFTLHGLFYVIPWTLEGRLLHELLDWRNFGVANLPGVISLLAGLLMWVTSLAPVRRLNFELFFYTHQLYFVFVVFLAMHVGDYIFSIAAAGIFLFMLDRFLRFCQSRKTVKILSAKCLPSGTVELVISKPANLEYNALSWIFLQVRELSWLQWHPFSVSSSPLDGKYHLSVLIKVLGDWTEKLRGHILSSSEDMPEEEQLMHYSQSLKASVEGPYGHESPYHLTYENLILVAGGIGISPFLAILSDILHRTRECKPCMPRNILIIWAVKKSDELPLLHAFDMESICPNFSNTLNLEIQTYVTRESVEPSLEEGKVRYQSSSFFATPCGNGMSALTGTGNIIWSGLYVIVSTLGLVITVGLLDILYINPYHISSSWYKGLLFVACMFASVVLFGGSVVACWHIWERKSLQNEDSEAVRDEKNIVSFQPTESDIHKNSSMESSVSSIKYGKRPNFEEIFGTVSERWGDVDIGVIVCGPPALQTSVAKECRRQNIARRSNEAIFHFNSHSFDL